MENLVVIDASEMALRVAKVKQAMAAAGMPCMLVSSNAGLYYLTGRVYSGYAYVALEREEPIFFVKRPAHLSHEQAVVVRKPEMILSALAERGVEAPRELGLELGAISYNTAMRLQAAFTPEGGAAPRLLDASRCLSQARAVKTDHEVSLMVISGAKHERVYRKIPALFEPGMTDIELQIEIEKLSRLEGCLGQFRVSGPDMELFMGNVLAGDNADSPSPYDFAMGGAGADPSLPVGANGTLLRPGMAVMVDMNGNFTGYMTDMTRTYAIGELPRLAIDAHQLSIDICRELAAMGRPGVEAKELYLKAEAMAKEAGMDKYFMGHRQHAGFVGHGVGIEVNELPVIAPRSRDVLAANNTIALEPKFVIPGVGAVGIENTYVVTPAGMRSITNAPQEIISMDK